MDIQTIRGLGTVVVMVAFIGLALWVFSARRKPDFDEATLLPFADDPQAAARVQAQQLQAQQVQAQQQEKSHRSPPQ